MEFTRYELDDMIDEAVNAAVDKATRPRRILRKLKIDHIAAVDRPAQEPARAVIMKRDRREEFARASSAEAFVKLSTEVGVAHFLKMVLNGEVENPYCKAAWERIIEYQSLATFPGTTRAQSVSKYLCTPLGMALWQVAKAAPLEVAKASGGEPGARAEDDEVELEPQSMLADRRLGRLTLEQARALGPNAARRVATPLRGVGDVRTEAQQNRNYSNPNPPPGPKPPGPATRVSVPMAGAGRKSATEKERAQRIYDNSPGYPGV